MDKEKKLGLGEILVLEKVIEPEELDQLLDTQQRDHKPLGQICVERGLLSPHGLKHVLKKYHRRMRLGEVLLTMGLIGPQQLDQALEELGRSKRRLGEFLIERGILSEDDITMALSEQLDIPRVIPDLALIDVKMLEGVSHRFLGAHQALPAFKNPNGAITVIMSDPLREETLRDLELFFKCPILPALATRSEITDALRQLQEQSTLKGLAQPPDLEFKVQKELMIEEGGLSDNESRTVSVVNYLISRAIRDGASDIHIEPQAARIRVRYRIDGVMHAKTDLPKDLGPPIASRIKALCGLDITERRRYQDGRIEAQISGRDYDLRISTYPSLYGENLVIRVLQRQTLLVTLEQLGFSPSTRQQYTRLMGTPSGVILVTGPTGSGKTTTLYASLTSLVNKGLAVVTVEDPIEYAIEGVVQAAYEGKLGVAHKDYIKAMMRQDPDVIMIGEIRDAETAGSAIQVSLTGHKVFSTFHTDDTVGALIRLLDMEIEPYLVASTVTAVLSQRLVRVICRYCREEERPNATQLAAFGLEPEHIASYPFFRGHGCPKCHQTGYKGRTAIHELLVVTDPIREAVLARKTATDVRTVAINRGRLVTLREDGLYKAIKGVTTLEEIERVVPQYSDETTRRTVTQVLELCGDSNPAGAEGRGSAPTRTHDESLPEPLFQVSVNCGDLRQERDRLVRLYQEYQRVARPRNRMAIREFMAQLVDHIQQAVNGHGGADAVLSIRYKGGTERIFMELPSTEPKEVTPKPAETAPV
ncbi:MAG: Flp pilus assembly complex ATPase component TadA [Nitrospirae bacterium]|nr:Flp pilus assembly complex ATPase component TadA [Nitrospirota bacterium]